MFPIAIALVAFIAGFVLLYAASKSRDSELQTVGRVAGLVALAAAVFILVFNMWTSIPAGSRGVVELFGEVDERPLDPGAHFINPLKEVTRMSVQIVATVDKHEAASKDLQEVVVTLGANVHLRPEKTPWIYQNVGSQWMATIVPNAERETLKAEIAHHNASDILQNRPQIKLAVQDEMAKWLDRYGIVLDELSIQNISFGKDYTSAIEAKQVEEQRALQKVYELQGAEKQAEIAKAQAAGTANAAIESARGAAESVRLAAQAEADAIRVRATATAESNEKIAASLTGPDGERVIRMEQIRRWSGNLPTTVLSGAVPFLELQGGAK